MKKINLMVILFVILVMGVAACGKKTEVSLDEITPTIEEENKTEENETEKDEIEKDEIEKDEIEKDETEVAENDEGARVEETTIEYVFPASKMADWQNAYQRKLCEIRNDNEKLNMPDAGADYAESYFLYDIDYSGIPELYVKYGDCEAAYHVIVYHFDQGQVTQLGELNAGHTSFYSTPQEGLMSYWGHMGYAGVTLLTLQDGVFHDESISEQDITQDENLEYEDADTLVPGAKYLVTQNISLDLPIELYGKTLSHTAGTLSKEEVRETLQNAYMNNGEICGVSGDGYGGDTGVINFEDYCKPGAIDEFIESDATVDDQQWVDLNQDGQDECVLKMRSPDGYMPFYVMLSLQNHTIYAYAFHYWDENVTFHENGTFSYETSYYNRIVFDKDQCYTIEE